MQSYVAPSGASIHVSVDEEQGAKALARGGPKDREHLLWSFLSENLTYDSVWDLGANYGQVSLAVTYPTGVPVHLVEANPSLLPYLERTVATHPNQSQITLHNVALSDHEGKANLFVRSEAIGKSSLVREVGDAITIPLRTLTGLWSPCPTGGSAIIKLDVEGSELAVLEGAAEALARLDNYAIMIELHPGFMRETAGSLGRYVELLCAYGYLWEQRENSRLRPFDFARFVRRGKLHDILICSGSGYAAQIREFNRAITSSQPTQPSGRRGLRSRLGAVRRRIHRLSASYDGRERAPAGR